MKQPMSGSAIEIEDRAMTATRTTTRTTTRRTTAAKPTAARTTAKAAKAAKAAKVTETRTIAEVLAENAAKALAAAKVDASVSGRDLADVLADLGLDPDGTIKPQKQKYVGPMLALRAAEHGYVIAPNGQPCNGDALAQICGAYPAETVVKGLISALGLGFNPYSHLNIGQQSMNLRNKARGALKNGLIRIADVDACLKSASAITYATKAE